jgi:DNA-binding transcriptional regulator YdaS (Cro superfamily)
MEHPLRRALKAVGGSPTALAMAIGGAVKRQNVGHWLKVGVVPAEQAPAIERAVRGVVAAEEMCPRTRFTRVPDPKWPHPKGRPCIDPCGPAPISEAMGGQDRRAA